MKWFSIPENQVKSIENTYLQALKNQFELQFMYVWGHEEMGQEYFYSTDTIISGYHFPFFPGIMQVHSHLFTVCKTSDYVSWSDKRGMARHQADLPVSSLGG